tara:strand:+ start:1039 stop:1980 length:942 start_codon:yes stop_codon:yes gene_type:complete
MRILVVGGMGNVGGRLAATLAKRGNHVTVLDVRSSPVEPYVVLDDCEVLVGDITEKAELDETFRLGQFDSVFHLAAVLSADAEKDFDRAWKVNMVGMRNVLLAATSYKVNKVVFSSTTASFGPGVEEPVRVDSPQWPVSLYGVTKVAGERLGVRMHYRWGMDFRGLRLPSVVSPFGAGGGVTAFCSQLYEHAVGRGHYQFYVEPGVGRPVVYVDDAVSALIQLHDANESSLTRRVYQLGGISATSEEMALSVLKELPNVQFTYEPDSTKNSLVKSLPMYVDDHDASDDWGWVPKYDLQGMTKRMIAELRSISE